MTTKLETGVPLPPEVETEQKAEEQAEKKKPRARRKKASEAPNAAANLIAALKFIAVAQKKVGTVPQQFCGISGNWVVACNGVMMVGTKVEDDLTACPHTYQLIDALVKCGQELNITQLSANVLSVKSDKFKALIPCVGFDELELPQPDPQIAAIDDRIKAAFDAVACLATEGAPNAVHAALLLQSGSAVATNGFALVEYWHGIDLPPGMLIPKASAVAVAKAGKPLVGFGYSGASATFWFDDGSFIKTQLFGERYPHYAGAINVEGLNPWPLPEEFFKGVHAVESFSKNGIVYFDNGVISSREVETEATTYKVEGLPEGMGFQAKYLTTLEGAMQKAHFDKENNRVFFFGDNVRGVLMGVDLKQETSYNPTTNAEFDDDIPF